MTHQLLLNIPENLYQILLEQAQKQGETIENVVLKSLEESQLPKNIDPLEQFIGAFNSDNSDWLEQHDYYLGKSHLESNN